jgi:hypothetical protein
LGLLFEIFGLYRNAIRHGKLRLAATLLVFGKTVQAEWIAVNPQESLARLIAFPDVVDMPSEAEACIDGISFQF